MAESNFVIKNGLVVNGSFVANSSAVNAAAIAATGLTIGTVSINATTINVGTTTINSTSYSGSAASANNALFLGGTAAASYALTSSLSDYQTTAGLAANVATLTSNNASNLGGVAAASYVNTSGAYTITGVHTYSANVIVNANVGIGTSTLNNRLSIKNDANNAVAMVYTENANTGANSFSGLVAVGGSATAKFWATGSSGGAAALGTDTPTPLQLFSNGVNRVVIAANGDINFASPVILGSSGVTFADGSKTVTDLGRPFTLLLGGANVNNYFPSSYNWINIDGVSGGASPNSTRGRRYITRYTYSSYTDPDTGFTQIVYTQSSNSQITVTNYSGSPMRINVIHGINDGTDDTASWIVYRDGTITNAYTHSGGTEIGSGSTPPGSGLVTATVTQDIAAGASTTFYLYAGVMTGSVTDNVAGYLQVSFNSWL